MVLQKNTIDIPFASGIDTKPDQKQLKGKLTGLENGIFTKPGSILKRNGYTRLDDNVFENNKENRKGKCLFVHENNLLQIGNQYTIAPSRMNLDDGSKIYSYLPEENNWVNSGDVYPVETSVETMFQTEMFSGKATITAMPDHSYLPDGYMMTVWYYVGQATAGYKIVSTSSSTLITEGVLFSNHSQPKVFGMDQSAHGHADRDFFVVSGDNTSNDINLEIFDETNDFAKSGVLNVINDAHNDMIWDACKYTDPNAALGDGIIIAYKSTDEAFPLKVKWIDKDGNVVHAYQKLEFVNSAITVFVVTDANGDDHTVICWHDGPNFQISYMVLNNIGSVVILAPTFVETVPVATYPSVYNIVGHQDPSTDADLVNGAYINLLIEVDKTWGGTYPATRNILIYQVDESANVAFWTDMFHLGLASKPVAKQGRTWFMAAYDSLTQPNYFLMSFREPVVDDDYALNTDAVILQDRAGGFTYGQGVPKMEEPENGVFSFAGLRFDRLLSDLFIQKSAVVGTIDTTVHQMSSDELGPTMQVTGGYLGDFDGRYQENNFLIRPKIAYYDEDVGTGELESGKIYQYISIYEWTDRKGQIHRSGLSEIYSFTPAADDTKLEILLSMTWNGDHDKSYTISIGIYRTLADGNIFHKIVVLPGNTAPYNARTDPDGWYLFADTYSDADIEDNETLYTTGGVVENSCAPSSLYVNKHMDRLWAISADDPNELWFTKKKAVGVGVEFSPYFKIRADDGLGGCVAGISMDSKQIVFKRDSIYAISGDGPNLLGQGQFSPVIPISTDVGCADKRSVTKTDLGIVFKSDKGYYLLTRSLQVQYIGAAVEEYNNLTVYDAKTVNDQNQVRILLTLGGFSGIVLSWDYLVNQWSVFTNHNGYDAVIWFDKYTYLRKPNLVFEPYVYQEDTSYLDHDELIDLKVETEWIKTAGIQGFQRVWWLHLLGDYKSPHTLTVEIAYDYNEFIYQTLQMGVTAALFGAADDPLFLRIKPKKQKCEAIKLTITDSAQTGTTESLTLSNLALVVGTKGRLKPMGVQHTRG